MINLLSPAVKNDIFFAHRNTKLLRWSLAFLGAIAGVGLIVAFGLFYMNQSINNYNDQISKTGAELKVQKLDDTQVQVESISSSLKLVIQVLGKEVLFSKLLRQIGSVVPAQASLTDLQIGKIQGGIDLTAVAADYDTATQLQVNLQDPSNKLFDKADILSITCGSSSTTDKRYPCTVNIRAQFAKNNPFLFINPSAGSK